MKILNCTYSGVIALLWAVMFVCTAWCAESTSLPIYTYADLVGRIYNLEALAQPPVMGECSGAATSHDRASAYDNASHRYVNWSYNNDGNGVVRKENAGDVLAEIKGPGVLWRIWSAKPEQGSIQIFIDGAENPVVNLPFRDLFDNKKEPFNYSMLNREMARGFNLFIPIAFQKSCKILGQSGWGKYFHCTYTQFPEGTQVPSFRGTFSSEEKSALAQAQSVIENRGSLSKDGNVLSKTCIVAPGESVAFFEVKCSGAITQLSLQSPLLQEKDPAKALRELSISIFWDGEKEPSVWAPLSDFFGCGYGANTYASLPSGLTKEGFFSRWYMPFGEGARIEIRNDGKCPQTIRMAVSMQPLETSPDKLLRFHAKWHRNNFGDKEPDRYFEDRWPDWPLLIVNGAKGRYCGMALHVWNPAPHSKENRFIPQLPPTKLPIPPGVEKAIMTRWWWGEGDEKFFVDGEDFPSTFGTGTEDYIGYAWCAPVVFDSHTQSQPRNYRNTGHIVVSRWHIGDNIPFQNSFEGCIEKYHGDNWPLLYAVTVFWYQSPNSPDRYKTLPVEERLDYFANPVLSPNWLKSLANNYQTCNALGITLIEAETADIIEISERAKATGQSMGRWGGDKNWSGGEQLFIRAQELNETLVLGIPTQDMAPKTLYLLPTFGPDYAILKIEVNGTVALPAFDTYSPEVKSTDIVKLGDFVPINGKFEIKMTVIGANKNAHIGRFCFGIDAIGVRPKAP